MEGGVIFVHVRAVHGLRQGIVRMLHVGGQGSAADDTTSRTGTSFEPGC